MTNDFKFVDTHCHIDLYREYKQVIEDAESKKIFTVAVTNTPSVFEKMQQILSGKVYLSPALGLHPQLVKERGRELGLMKELMSQTKFIGEIGLDYSDSSPEDQRHQRQIFDSILELCSQTKGKILTIHSRRAAEDVVSAIGGNFSGKIILHWYSGSVKVLERAVEFGYYFSVNPAMVNSKSGLEILKNIPLKRLLTESDGPFVMFSNSMASPRNMEALVQKIALFLNKTNDEMQTIIAENFTNCLE